MDKRLAACHVTVSLYPSMRKNVQLHELLLVAQAASSMALRDELLKPIWHAFTALDLDKSGKVSKSQLKVWNYLPRSCVCQTNPRHVVPFIIKKLHAGTVFERPNKRLPSK